MYIVQYLYIIYLYIIKGNFNNLNSKESVYFLSVTRERGSHVTANIEQESFPYIYDLRSLEQEF